ncbi:MAG TPA: pseudouridine synthase [Opitutus sp.]|nr:pseudouridine synthase [Opitutus sp.]
MQKVLAAAGIASRRKAEELITEGRVSINGHVVTEMGTKADPRMDEIRVDGQLIGRPERHVYFMVYKPKGHVTTVADPEGRPTVMHLMEGIRERVFPVGRLDYMSEGLLLMTNDGELMAQLTAAKSHVPKTYQVKVSGHPTEEQIDKLRAGVWLPPEPGMTGKRGKKQPGVERRSFGVKTQPAQIELVRDQENPWYEVTLIEGRNRQIRRMFEEIGFHIEKIKRVRYGTLELNVEPGQWRQLTFSEINELKRSLKKPFRIAPPRPRRDTEEPESAPGPRREPRAPRSDARTARGPERPQRSRSERPGYAERPAREGFAARPPRREEGGESRPPRRVSGGFGDRPQRREGGSFQGRPPRREGEGFQSRPPRRESGSFPRRDRESFETRPPRRASGGFDERPRRERPASGEERPRRERPAFGQDRPRRERPAFGQDRPRRERPAFGEDRPRRERPQFGEGRPRREGGGFGQQREGGTARERGFADRGARGERPTRNAGPRGERPTGPRGERPSGPRGGRPAGPGGERPSGARGPRREGGEGGGGRGFRREGPPRGDRPQNRRGPGSRSSGPRNRRD